METIFTHTWKTPGRRIVLASKSPRRSALLRQMGMAFETMSPSVFNEESYLDANNLSGSIQALASAKAKSVSKEFPEALVLGADTIVVCNGEILGKPENEKRAFSMLSMLSGKSHVVLTGIALVCEKCGFMQSSAESTNVFFRNVPTEELLAYIDTKDCFDKAGGYGIQGSAMVFVSTIEGCFYNVVGLPIAKTISLFNAYVTRKESDNV